MKNSTKIAKARIRDTDICLCHLLPGVSLVVVHPQTRQDPKQKVVEEAEEAEEGENKNPDPSGTLTYSTIKETLLA